MNPHRRIKQAVQRKRVAAKNAAARNLSARAKVIAAVALVTMLIAGWTMLAYSGALDSAFSRADKKAHNQTVSPASFNSNSPSKEYIYAGRLLATEEPDPCGNDIQPPTITCAGNLSRSTDPGQCSAAVIYTAPSVSDNCPGVRTPVCNPASGSTFLKGTTTINCTVADANGNQASCSFTATVNDTQVPAITCPANVVKSTDPNQCSAAVNYPNATASDNCAGVGPPVCVPPSGSAFAKGTTTVTCSVNDVSGNAANCSFTVTVNDTQAPAITCPGSVTAVTASFGASSAVVTYPNASASDNCPGVVSSCNPPSGSTFPVGFTTVTCTATDASGNTASCTFQVSLFSICLQDDSNANNRILINTATGDYRFCCNGITFTGRGTMSIQGSTYTLVHNTLDRRLLVRATGTGGGFGTASLQSPPGTLRCNITESNSSNNTTCTTCR